MVLGTWSSQGNTLDFHSRGSGFNPDTSVCGFLFLQSEDIISVKDKTLGIWRTQGPNCVLQSTWNCRFPLPATILMIIHSFGVPESPMSTPPRKCILYPCLGGYMPGRSSQTRPGGMKCKQKQSCCHKFNSQLQIFHMVVSWLFRTPYFEAHTLYSCGQVCTHGCVSTQAYVV
jgi:hypothetical protein